MTANTDQLRAELRARNEASYARLRAEPLEAATAFREHIEPLGRGTEPCAAVEAAAHDFASFRDTFERDVPGEWASLVRMLARQLAEAVIACPDPEAAGLSLAVRVVDAMPAPTIEADRRDNAILQGDLFGWVGKAPSILTYPRHDNDVPLRTGYVENDSPQLALPGLDAPDSQIVTHPALMLVEEAGFGPMTAGSGARKDKVLLVNWLADVEREVRTPSGRYTLRPMLRDIVHRRLWPAPVETGTGEGTRSMWKPSRHAPIVRRSMNALTLAGLILDDRREHRPVMVRTLPDFYDLDSRAVVEIAMGELSDRGAMIHRPALTAAGVVSDAAFDGCLALAMLWDRAKAKNGGFRVYATRPAALRDSDGFLTRADGTRITAHAATPLTGKDGKPLWKAGEVPVRNWRHPQAIIHGTERHPAADKAPTLDRNDRRRLFYGHRSDGLTVNGRAKAADRADARLRALATEGRIVIEDCGKDGWRILEARRSEGNIG